MRVWLDWARHAVVTNKAESQKDSADIFGEAKPLLSDWIKELNRDELISALMALPSESQPSAGVRVNGIQYDLGHGRPAQYLELGQLRSRRVRRGRVQCHAHHGAEHSHQHHG
jgi:hypothetical protein